MRVTIDNKLQVTIISVERLYIENKKHMMSFAQICDGQNVTTKWLAFLLRVR